MTRKTQKVCTNVLRVITQASIDKSPLAFLDFFYRSPGIHRDPSHLHLFQVLAEELSPNNPRSGFINLRGKTRSTRQYPRHLYRQTTGAMHVIEDCLDRLKVENPAAYEAKREELRARVLGLS